ncbi:MAG: hypothetical protein U0869_10560 [Chloroflexota bacterium]
MSVWWRRSIASVVAVGMLVSGCWLVSTPGLGSVVRSVRRLPYVDSVTYRAGGFLDPEALDVVVLDNTTEEQVAQLYCDILIPHGATDENTLIYNASETLYFELPDCRSGNARARSQPVPS